MPSGITHEIYEGNTDVNKYMERVARSMTDFIHMRDEASSSTLTKRDTAKHYEKEVPLKEKALEGFENLTNAQAQALWKKEQAAEKERVQKARVKNAEQAKNYNEVLAKVEALDFPEILSYAKEYAVKYLRESMEFDVSTPEQLDRYYSFVPKSFDEWYKEKLGSLQQDVAYYRRTLAEYKARDAEFNERIDAWSSLVGYKIV